MLGCVPEDSSLLISTHQIGDVEQILDEAVFIKEGKILFHRSVDEIREETGKSLADAYMEEFR
jgi:ABC-2 type transport system ATP-binding protein